MHDWLSRLHRSRRARFLTLSAVGIVSLGSCGGAVLANYTVAGMNTFPHSEAAQSDWRAAEPEWVREAAMAAGGDTDRSAGFSSTATEAYSDAAD
ncbi:hypothetical protein OF829_12075 [Sphingomonas sp. LB-2]|uniref:hypothetical protein n=1 Tax=Sphingomonas caeni TaxID=2984949 RepID=UPI00222F94A8|nr:hypothetical protein [Sphingomonas caeni]MCW3847977.1 hypothetical protein [Sphingomonas caeni]